MRIAVLAHARHPVARPFAGGMEAHAWALADGLTARGHEVVLFASGGSDPRFTIAPVTPVSYERLFPGAEHRGDPALIARVDADHAAACAAIADGGFDVVHNNSLHRFPVAAEQLARVATVTSLHVPAYDALSGFIRESVGPGHLVSGTSRSHLAGWWPEGAPAGVSVLPNGIDPAEWPFGASGDGGAIWSGRITPDKGAHLAVRAARMAGVPLTLFGAIEDPAYFESNVAPLLGGDIRYGGHLHADALAGELRRASVYLATPCWEEPFGLAMVEAMASGLPVASFDRGAAREVAGEAGRFAPGGDVATLAQAIRAAMAISRRAARNRVKRLFTQARWLDGCEALYRAALAGRARRAA